MLELDCTALTPDDVFQTSGHVDRFADWMCRDPATGDYLRADHLVKNVLEARLKGDKLARGISARQQEDEVEEDTKKAKSKVKDIKAAKLGDATVKEYEEIIAKATIQLHYDKRC